MLEIYKGVQVKYIIRDFFSERLQKDKLRKLKDIKFSARAISFRLKKHRFHRKLRIKKTRKTETLSA
jgi:hypothetical protein